MASVYGDTFLDAFAKISHHFSNIFTGIDTITLLIASFTSERVCSPLT